MQGSNEDSQTNSMTIGDLSELIQTIHRQLECDSVFVAPRLSESSFFLTPKYGRAPC